MFSRSLLRFVFTAVCPLLSLATPAQALPQTVQDRYTVGQKAPPFSVRDQYGNPFSLQRQHGKWVILHFAVPNLELHLEEQMAQETRTFSDLVNANGTPLVYATIALIDPFPNSSSVKSGTEWAVKFNITGPVLTPGNLPPKRSLLWGNFFAYQNNMRTYGTAEGDGTPMTVIIDPEGTIVTIAGGVLSGDDLLHKIGRGDLAMPPVPPLLAPISFDLSFTYNDVTVGRAEPRADFYDRSFPNSGLPEGMEIDCTENWASGGYSIAVTADLNGVPEIVPLAEDAQMTFRLSNLQWTGPAPLALPVNVPLLLRGTDRNYHSGGANLSIATADEVSFGPVSIADTHLKNITDFLIGFRFLPAHLIAYYETLQLASRDRLLQAYVAQARRFSEPGRNWKVAIRDLQLWKHRYTRLPNTNAQAAAFYPTLVDRTIELLQDGQN